ncbi:MAG: hypothetical protein ACI4IJ_09710 [Acutalibacteraceae bacterium]
MSSFWKVLVMGATAAAAVVVAKEVIERNEKGEDCSPMSVIKGIGRKIGVMCGCKECCGDSDDVDDDFFDDFEEFELDDDDIFDTFDMESDELTADGYVVEFSSEEDNKEEATEENAADETDAQDSEVSETDEKDEKSDK